MANKFFVQPCGTYTLPPGASRSVYVRTGFKIAQYQGTGASFVVEGTKADGSLWATEAEAIEACRAADTGQSDGMAFASYADD